MITFGRFLLILSVCCLSCDNDEAEIPRLITSEAQQIGTTSAVLETEIIETGSIRPIRYGFLWDTAGGLNIFTAANTLDLGSTSDKRKYSIKLEALSPNTQYFVRSFAANDDYTRVYYGNEIAFTTLP
ncbi:MAG: hypothetical protein RIA63_03560 [Cyclobacteriaceae bacterium]